ncbi:MAG: hypothetical protein FWD87_10595 [Spirochaetaceae bacterium]|nr:hypothetical protein [Spirochaetaceae bacterium]
MKIIEASDKVDNIVKNLFVSTEKKQIIEIFDEYEITDPSEKIALLRKCMQVQSTSCIPANITPEEEYADELEIFIEGSWRLLTVTSE